MATIKSYTSLEQSKKLAEILPIDSSDMQWFLEEDYGIVQIKEELQDWGGDCTIPCWSLAELLAVLPSGKALIHDKESGEYKCICYNYDTAFYSNPIDACYELILKLHELNLL